ncbi:hypothetical protein FHS95_004013 [Sphingomonas naasensis]|uniref:DUF2271 domain-containing protein n=1 Tax=Sphingomonas naasensis TaxID=1344951 RepID=A0A4S1WIG6_9SPHN|nr:DUF2271 domain-containing protein [Sphingomonas naasensis]NIJ22298.1 hypothetical protein [Sphingomonas naasensis]TGX40696.1 DUF2271 domain-containing protein [Sphingomonas naasensis]
MQIRLTGLTVTALGASALVAGPAAAQALDLTVTIPRLSVAEYHRPYVAVWLEKEGVAPRTIQVWYDVNKAGGEGTKWLRDVRQWWRASGRAMAFPADGVTGATRAPGAAKVRLVGGRGGMPTLSPGNYTLVVEAAREVGGRELLRLPFAWNGSSATASGKGATELGAVSLTLKR